MSKSMMDAAFGHHVWATLRLLDVCLGMSPEQLETAVPGTYGSILDTQRHLVGADSWYLSVINADDSVLIDEEQMGLAELRAVMQRQEATWSRVLVEHLDPDAVSKEVDVDDVYQKDATMGIRLAQALHHGTDHRSQICTALTSLGVEASAIDVWDFGIQARSVVETLPST